MKPLIIGIAGGTGSGKSTVARNVAQALSTSSVAFIDMDAYYRNFSHVPLEERRQINWDHPDAFDWELLLAQLTALIGGQAIDKPEQQDQARIRRYHPDASEGECVVTPILRRTRVPVRLGAAH